MPRAQSRCVQPQRIVEMTAATLTTPAAVTNTAPEEPSLPAVDRATSESEGIMARVERLRAHQERMRLEREDFYSRTMQRACDLANGNSHEHK